MNYDDSNILTFLVDETLRNSSNETSLVPLIFSYNQELKSYRFTDATDRERYLDLPMNFLKFSQLMEKQFIQLSIESRDDRDFLLILKDYFSLHDEIRDLKIVHHQTKENHFVVKCEYLDQSQDTQAA
ncbi:hypothetical protein N9N67_00040 [Bacteriovoracaceae bacterium]|nr:hypothetical protein [Bacteriovoracaceae bacterium]